MHKFLFGEITYLFRPSNLAKCQRRICREREFHVSGHNFLVIEIQILRIYRYQMMSGRAMGLFAILRKPGIARSF